MCLNVFVSVCISVCLCPYAFMLGLAVCKYLWLSMFDDEIRAIIKRKPLFQHINALERYKLLPEKFKAGARTAYILELPPLHCFDSFIIKEQEKVVFLFCFATSSANFLEEKMKI